jgi:hypothetical protein
VLVRGVGVAACVLAILAGVAPAAAQTEPVDPEEIPEFDPLNVAFASYVGSGIYVVGDNTAWVLRIPASAGLRREDENAFGVRFRVTTTLAFFNFRPTDILEGIIPERIGAVTILPGVSFPIKLTEKWRIEPFLDFGAGWLTDQRGATPIFGSGVYSRAEFPTKRSKVILWNRLIYAREFTTGDSVADDDFLLFEVEPEYRIPVVAIKKRRVDIGIFLSGEWYLNKLVILEPLGEDLELGNRWEFGFTFGTVERLRFWKITAPRLGLGYRWGDLANGIRFIFSFRY